MSIPNRHRRPPVLWIGILLAGGLPIAPAGAGEWAEAHRLGSAWVTDSGTAAELSPSESSDDTDATLTSLFQPQPALLPTQELRPQTPLPTAAGELSASLFGTDRIGRSLLGQPSWRGGGPSTSLILGIEALPRVTTDAGSLMGKSPSALGVEVQRRTPIVSDPRVRGSRVGQLAASGSYWVPARVDLDTMLSKLDSRIIDQMIVIKGPYSAWYGPGFHFVDVGLLKTPRYSGGFQSHGSTSFDYKVNGQQWYGRQRLWGGGANLGFRFGYGHATGNDYTAGNGVGIPSSYKSRDIDAALGVDLTPDNPVEFNYLRLDQTNVEFPGMIFDMDYLVTDGYQLEYVLENQPRFDRLAIDAWYNRTRFIGSAQRPGKRRQFPFLDYMQYVGFTDVDSTSTGFQAAVTWGDVESANLTFGTDLRHLRQELNEVSSGQIVPTFWNNANSPIPRSQWTDPGIFLEQVIPIGERLVVIGGARVDLVSTQVTDDPEKLLHLGNWPVDDQSSLAEILGTDEFDQSFAVWSAYLTGEYRLGPYWTVLAAGGHGERPPSLTELYAAQPFLLLLQNGMNTATGDPRLRPERLWQVDLGLKCEYPRFRGGVTAFHAWVRDYITFENLQIVRGPPFGQVEQVNLKYVNTDRATLAGFELHAEYDLRSWVTPFATMQYVEGRDHTRNGDFATRPVAPGSPSVRVPGLPRGFFSGVAGPSSEPLPSIPPLESRLGFWLHPASPERRWSVELSARVVAPQTLVADSLLETPTPGFTVWDLRGYWQPSDNLLLVAGVENFTNKTYREHLDYRSRSGIAVYQPGVNFYFGSELAY